MKWIIGLILFFSVVSFSQTPDKTTIMQSGQYYYGSGAAIDVNEARDLALSELTSQIALRVSSSFERKVSESGRALNETVQSILKTHSAATLKNVNSLPPKTLADGRIEIFLYLEKSEVEKIFAERRRLIAEMVANANKYEREGNLAFALKHDYFAAILLNSLPDETMVLDGVNYTTVIPQHINKILTGISFSLHKDQKISAKEREITLSMSYVGQSIGLLDFTFWDGTDQVAAQGRDGQATFRLLGASTGFESIKLSVKYAYYEARAEYAAVGDLWPLVEKPQFQSTQTVVLAKTPLAPPSPQVKWNVRINTQESVAVLPHILNATVAFLDVISKGNAESVRQKYQSDSFLLNKIQNYLKFNDPQPQEREIAADLHKTRGGYELRKIRMTHRYPSINKISTEYLTLDFTESSALNDMNVSITEGLYQRFVKESDFGKDWQNRQEIIKFIEKYRTAYLTRDIETVDMMFAEEALIIVGRRIERRKLPDQTVQYERLSNEPEYESIKMNKTDFLKRQKQIFKAQQDIFLDFGSFDIIRKLNAEGVYGVQMRQSYNSSTYSDEGYLFLMIDFEQKDPLIYVRAWQPNEWDEDALVRTANFKIWK